MTLSTSKKAMSESRKLLGDIRAHTLIQMLLERHSQKNHAHGLDLEEYFHYEHVSRQPLELLNHVGLCKSERTGRRREKLHIQNHIIRLDALYKVQTNKPLAYTGN